MTTLDTLARSSANAVHESVSMVPVPIGGVGAARWAALWRSAGYAMAGAAAAVVAVLGLLVLSTPSDDVADTPSTTVAPPTTVDAQTPTTTIPVEVPETPAPVVLPPDGDVAPRAAQPPRISIISPEDGTETYDKTVVVVGVVEEGAEVFGPTDEPVRVNEDGMWSAEIGLREGENRIVFSATNGSDVKGAAAITVTRLVRPDTTTTTKPTTTTTTKPTTTTTEPPPTWEFSAHATYNTCAEIPPYDIYYGTGKPGTTIEIISEYGSANVTVNESGEWSKKVFFESAPLGVQFQVKVKDFTGEKIFFEFTHTEV